MRKIYEFSRKEILGDASPEPWVDNIRERSRNYVANFSDVLLDKDKNLCVVSFRVSQAGKSTQFVRVNLKDFWKIYSSEKDKPAPLSLQNILNLVITSGDIEIFCSCPHWVYGGYNYMATKLDYAFKQREERFPKIRNPQLKGTVCKHAFRVLQLLPNNTLSISSAINRQLKEE